MSCAEKLLEPSLDGPLRIGYVYDSKLSTTCISVSWADKPTTPSVEKHAQLARVVYYLY